MNENWPPSWPRALNSSRRTNENKYRNNEKKIKFESESSADIDCTICPVRRKHYVSEQIEFGTSKIKLSHELGSERVSAAVRASEASNAE